MSAANKILSVHLERRAVVYVRQSSPQQVENNLESQRRQYALRERAVVLGWRADQVVVIDDDLGISGAHSENRPGYQRLVSMLALREVGLVLGIEFSRLARNCLDWYQLLEVASAFGVLIADEDTVCDPSDFNDRLLLGLRGTISEVELHQIQSRMSRGRMNKAQRGDLEVTLPIGYERDNEAKTRKTADQAVRSAVQNVFALFRQLRSLRGVLKELRRRGAELPYWSQAPGLPKRLAWRPPTYDAIYSMVRTPAYAGVYVYGRRKRHYDPVAKKTHVEMVPSSQWEVVIPDHHEGYVTRDEYDENQTILRNNGYAAAMSRGAAREGSALLQGLVYCKRCGHKMRPRYTSRRYYYYCDQEHRRRGEPICGRASAMRVDGVFEELFLEVLNDGTVDLTFQLARRHRDEMASLRKQWDQKLQRLEYEANLARRRYESVDPENRLVTSTLEQEWNQRLEALEQAKADFARHFQPAKAEGVGIDEVKAALRTLPERWRSDMLSIEEKKEMVRSVVDKIFLNTQGKVVRVEILWQGGTLTELDVPKYLFTAGRIYHRVAALAGERTDGEIAELLNQEGTRTVKGKPWTSRRVMDFRLSNGIPSGFTTSSKARLPDSGHLSSGELAAHLGVNVATIQKWFRVGILEGRQTGRQAQLWVRADDDAVARLNGSAPVDSTAISMRHLMKTTGKPERDIVEWAKREGHRILRVRRGKTACFYVQPVGSHIRVCR